MTFFGETPIFGKMPTFLENFRASLDLNHPCLWTSTSTAKN